MIAPEGFTQKPFNREEYAAKLRAEMAEYGEQRANDSRAFWFPLGIVAGIFLTLVLIYLSKRP